MLEKFENSNIHVDELPQLEDIEYRSISKDYLWVKILSYFIRIAVIFGGYFILAFSMKDALPLWLRQLLPVVIGVWALFGIFSLYKVFKSKGYGLRQHDVTYKNGWLWKRWTTIPYYRIQHCDVSSGPIERMFELCTLNIYTAGGSNSDLSIPGLTTGMGNQLKKLILQKMGDDEEE